MNAKRRLQRAANLLGRVGLAAMLVGGATRAFAQAQPAEQPTPDQMVDALNAVFGKHPGDRPVHAKGVVFEGTFTPSAQVASLSKAAHLQKTPSQITVRFSDFAGVPTIPDADPLASPHGLAIAFKLPDGSETDIVAHSFNGFPSATPADFRDLLLALAASGPDAQKPTPLDTYLGSHPAAKAFLTTPKPPPVSFATLSYFGVDAFKFTNAEGASKFGRYQIIPDAGDQSLPSAQLAAAGPNYLSDELRQRVQHGPAKFRLLVQLAEPGDTTTDPTVVWPSSRPTVDLGEIAVTAPVADSAAAEKQLLFTPGRLVDGIELSADPILAARDPAYAVSFSRRSQ
jgi:catalase